MRLNIKIVYIESFLNLLLDLVDIKIIVEIVYENKSLVIVDSIFGILIV